MRHRLSLRCAVQGFASAALESNGTRVRGGERTAGENSQISCTGKSHLVQAIGQAAIQQGYRVLYRETHKLLDNLAEATIDGARKEHMELIGCESVPHH